MLVFEGLAIFFRLDVVIPPGVFNDGSELVEFIAFSLKEPLTIRSYRLGSLSWYEMPMPVLAFPCGSRSTTTHALPVIETSKGRMSFKSWIFKEPLYVNEYGILEPTRSKKKSKY